MVNPVADVVERPINSNAEAHVIFKKQQKKGERFIPCKITFLYLRDRFPLHH